uniref:NADH-ubiquinone oxidoreductase chain 6 n=1 Tax=Psococerastis albimaculata TaxID=1264641 RepID=M9P723_9NEOP|nr:NADH dehydrogenase subunit 6 [Psococerastis albimaculata]AFY16894.1 NADH dehydrogenase subunit 6 [Psococerastis albimaculata]
MTYIFLSLTMFLNMIFFILMTPLSLGLTLILQTLLLSLLLGTMTSSFWFLYLLVLIFIGGMLVLFIYVTSIFPNEKFSFTQNNIFILLISVSLLSTILYILNMNFIMTPNLNYLENILSMKSNTIMISTIKIFNTQANMILIFLVNYLFYCMMIVIKMTAFFKGPLRKMI